MEMMIVIVTLVVISMMVVAMMLMVAMVVAVTLVSGCAGGDAYSRDNVQTAVIITAV